MRVLGVLLILIGMAVGGFALLMPTSVQVETSTPSGRALHQVHNLSMAEDRRQTLQLGGFAILIGVLLFGFGTVAAAKQNHQDSTRRKWLATLPPPTADDIDASGRR